MEDIRKCTESVQKSNIEQTAYFRAWGEKNNLDLEKYRKQVQDELKAENKTNEEGIYFACLWLPITLFLTKELT